MSELDDSTAALIDRVRAGDRDALADFVELRRPQLLAFIGRSLSDALQRKVEPQDILQETTISAVNSLGEMDLSERDPFGWLCQLAERRIIDAHRHHFGAKKRAADREVGLGGPGTDSQRGGFIDLLVASMTTASKAFSRGQKELALLTALEALPEEQREALRLRYVEGLPTKEIAGRLGKTDGALRVMLTRSLAKLQTLLKDDPRFREST